MYQNRKKMLIVSGVSVLVLVCFGVAAWAIINAGNQIPTDSIISANLSGATVYLEAGQFQYDSMSFNDWLIYNFPDRIVYSTSGTKTTYQYYKTDSSSSYTLIATLVKDSSNNSYSLSTGKTTTMDLLTSSYSYGTSQLSFENTYSFSSSGDDYQLSKSNNSYSATLTSEITNANFDMSLTTANTVNEETSEVTATTYTTSIFSNTNTLMWQKQVNVPTSSTNNIVETYSSSKLTSNLTITYTPTTSSDNVTYYSVSYQYGTNSITTQVALFTVLGIRSDTNSDGITVYDFSGSNLTTREYLLYVPNFF